MGRICPTRSTASLSPLGPPVLDAREGERPSWQVTPHPDQIITGPPAVGSPRPPLQRFHPKTTPRSPPLPRSDRLGSTTPLGRPGSCRPLPAQNTQINTTHPAYHTTPEGDACAATKQLSNTLLNYSHRDWDKAQRADPLCDATRRSKQLGRPDPPPRSLCDHLPSHKRPISPTSLTSPLKVAC